MERHADVIWSTFFGHAANAVTEQIVQDRTRGEPLDAGSYIMQWRLSVGVPGVCSVAGLIVAVLANKKTWYGPLVKIR